ncbi:MAG TPA: ATP-binding protein [Pyrinomonadaceae bacterium]|nr:ATP-binding protein [Pyrinomonadaceae bacterium]
MSSDRQPNSRRILGRVPPDQFVGRVAELQQLILHPSRVGGPRGLLLLLAPSAGVSELLRQAYDALFNRRSDIIPIYFAFTRNESTSVSASIEFLNTFLQQYVAFRRDEPALCQASLTLTDLVQLAPSSDYEWIQRLVDSYNLQRFSNDDRALVRFCLSVPQRVPSRHGRPFLMLDGIQLAEHLNGSVALGKEVLRTFTRGSLPFAFAGLRRQVLNSALAAHSDFESLEIIRLERLSVEEARVLVEHVAHRQQVATSEGTRDLLVQQFECSPLFITTFVQAARDKNVSLTTYLSCEQLYADELMGGRMHSYFASVLEDIALAETRRELIAILCEAAVGEDRRVPLETWRQRLHVDAHELEALLRGLHEQELINWDDSYVEVTGGSRVWKDYFRVRYRLEVLNEPRALVVADTITASLKRAPHTMAQHYRRRAALGLPDLLKGFNGQRVPQILFQYDRFSKELKGAPSAEIAAGLENESDLIRLPQVVHTASCASFDFVLQQVCDNDRCVVAHSFEGGNYNDANQLVWLVVEVESKLEADAELARVWSDRLEELARKCAFGRFQIWLIANEGFDAEACKVLERRGAFYSSRQQVELLSARVNELVGQPATRVQDANEFMMVLPMGEDTELIAASTAEQIARRLTFRPEAINQIKTAVVEACINASEHSFSPDRKIYQRFRVENDRLVVTISSRGVVPPNSTGAASPDEGPQLGTYDAASERRGWGLKLIRTLMDEVEFERVDEGTSLKMTKYLRNSSS